MKSVKLKKTLLILFSTVLFLMHYTLAAQEEKSSVSRLSIKTNAFEWLLTIPNVGVEYDLGKTEYNKFTAGLSAKYNWNTYHNMAPSVVFNLMDVRPEFRYYYRTRKPERGSVHHWYDINKHLVERKNPHPWRAHYIGLYGNYGHYAFKFSETGVQGQVAGLGVSSGYAIPLYEYKKGYVDLELGFALGVQWATKDEFVLDHEHGQYINTSSRDKFTFTPFPVLTELRAAFVWRTKSIKDKVKDDVEKHRVKRHYEKIKNDFHQPVLDMTKAYYEELLTNTKSSRERNKIMVTEDLYNEGYLDQMVSVVERQKMNIASSFPDEMKNHDREEIRKLVREYELELEEKVEDARAETVKIFMKESKAYFKELKRQARKNAAKNKKKAE